MATIMNGTALSDKIRASVKEEVDKLSTKPVLAVVQVGKNEGSTVYVNIKHKRCAEVGIESMRVEFDERITQEELISEVVKLNDDGVVHGVLVQLPLPGHIKEEDVIGSIAPDKDVDGITQENLGKLVRSEDGFISCTPQGVMKLLDEYTVTLEGKHAVVIGRSIIVGKPLSLLLLERNATVTMCHSKTSDLKGIVRQADILVAAVGKPRFVTADMVKDGACVVDVGINRFETGLVGDVDFEAVKEKASFITPVPHGVGPMTVACLLENTLKAYKKQC